MESLSIHRRYCVKAIDDSHNFQLPFASVCPLSKYKTTCKTFDFKVSLICVENESEGEERFRLNGFSETH